MKVVILCVLHAIIHGLFSLFPVQPSNAWIAQFFFYIFIINVAVNKYVPLLVSLLLWLLMCLAMLAEFVSSSKTLKTSRATIWVSNLDFSYNSMWMFACLTNTTKNTRIVQFSLEIIVMIVLLKYIEFLKVCLSAKNFWIICEGFQKVFLKFLIRLILSCWEIETFYITWRTNSTFFIKRFFLPISRARLRVFFTLAN